MGLRDMLGDASDHVLATIGGINATVVAFVKGVELHFNFSGRAAVLSVALKDVKKVRVDIDHALIAKANGKLTDTDVEMIQRDFHRLIDAIGEFMTGSGMADNSDADAS